MTSGGAFDPTAWLDLLHRHHVDFIVVGGYAATLHGARRPTMDIDVVPRWEAENLKRLCDALRDVDAVSTTGPPVAGDDITSDVLIDREVMTWHTSIGRIDTLVGIPDSDGMPVSFADLRDRARRVAVDDQVVVVGRPGRHHHVQGVRRTPQGQGGTSRAPQAAGPARELNDWPSARPVSGQRGIWRSSTGCPQAFHQSERGRWNDCASS